MKTMVMSLVVTLAMIATANAAPLKGAQLKDALNKEALKLGTSKDVASEIDTLRTLINKYNEDMAGETNQAKKDEYKAKAAKAFNDFISNNKGVLEVLAKQSGVAADRLVNFLRAAPEAKLVAAYFNLPAEAKDTKVEAELRTIIQKAGTQLEGVTSDRRQAVYKALILSTSDIGGNYERFRTALAEGLNANKSLETALVEAAKVVLGKDAKQETIDAFLKELAKCKV